MQETVTNTQRENGAEPAVLLTDEVVVLTEPIERSRAESNFVNTVENRVRLLHSISIAKGFLTLLEWPRGRAKEP